MSTSYPPTMQTMKTFPNFHNHLEKNNNNNNISHFPDKFNLVFRLICYENVYICIKFEISNQDGKLSPHSRAFQLKRVV
jgi:hypothetical protein